MGAEELSGVEGIEEPSAVPPEPRPASLGFFAAGLISPVLFPNLFVSSTTEDQSEQILCEILEVVTAIVPHFADLTRSTLIVHRVSGGTTNRLYRVSDARHPTAPAVVVRVFGEHTELLIDREKETAVAAQLAANGVTTLYYGSFGNGRVEAWMMSYRTVKFADMQPCSTLNGCLICARLVAGLHDLTIVEKDNPQRAPQLGLLLQRFSTAAISADFGEKPNQEVALERLDLSRVHMELEWLKQYLPLSDAFPRFYQQVTQSSSHPRIADLAAEFALSSVICHNDLHLENILVNDQTGHGLLIDLEYGMHNFRAYDFADHFNEYSGLSCDWGRCHPTTSDMRRFLRYYLEASKEGNQLLASLNAEAERECFLEELRRWTCRFCLINHIVWTYWSVVEACNSTIEFDYLGYGSQRMVGYFYLKGIYSDLFPAL
eukprot:RCo005972